MNKKIAVIEDDLAIASMYEFKLKTSGYEVVVALDGKNGLAAIKAFVPDLILLDIMMPEMTGDKLLEKLRATDWGKAIRVVVLTNVSEDEAPEDLNKFNVDRYILKAHHTPTQVLKIVREVLGE